MPEISPDELARAEAQRQADLAEHQRQLALAQAQAEADHELALEHQMALDEARRRTPLDNIDHDPLREAFRVDNRGPDVRPKRQRTPPCSLTPKPHPTHRRPLDHNRSLDAWSEGTK